METEPQITFRNMDHSDAVEARIRERIERLERFFDRITSCRVVVEAPERRHHKGKLYHVSVDILVPGEELVVNRHPKDKHAHEDVYVAIRDAFNAAQRRLEDHVRKTNGQVKTHDVPLHGSVVRLFPDQGYGFIAASDGREVYFHRNSVLRDGFDGLKVGSDVRLVVAEGESAEGPQASTVEVLEGRHIMEQP
jgi:ribosomal subunit interface protein